MGEPDLFVGMSKRSFFGSILLYAIVYVALGALSLATAYIQTNTAAIWVASGYSVGLLTSRGLSRWPAVAIGSFALNATLNLTSNGGMSLGAAMATAGGIAFGNTAEAVIGAYLARRVAAGTAFFSRPRSVLAFASLVVPLAPIVSMIVGVLASHLGGVSSSGSVLEVMLTWYTANAIGILIFACPVMILLTKVDFPKPDGEVGGWIEVLILVALLCFASEAICGIYLHDSLRGWPRTYMVIPLLFWASYRFGTVGAVLSVQLVTVVSVIGTMRGFAAFPADTASRSLIYLQVFLGIVSVMTLMISAGLWENWDLRANLEDRVRARTSDVDRHLREREAFTALVVHDLQSPLYGVRNALRVAADAIGSQRISPEELAPALTLMEQTCSTLAGRVATLLTPVQSRSSDSARSIDLGIIIERIASAHWVRIEEKGSALRFLGDPTLQLRSPDKVEHIIDTLVDNAIKFSFAGSPIVITTATTDEHVEIRVTDHGCGIGPALAETLFQPKVTDRRRSADSGTGLGLYLAREHARGLGGQLSYSAAQPQGSTFHLILPVRS